MDDENIIIVWNLSIKNHSFLLSLAFSKTYFLKYEMEK